MVLTGAVRRATRAILVLIATAVAGCTGVTPGPTFDDPLVTFWSQILSPDGIPPDAKPVVGIIWTDPLQRQADIVMPHGWMTTRPAPGDATNVVIVDVYRPPPPSAIVTITAPSGEQARLALGEAVLVDDRDDDGFEVSGPQAEIAEPDSYVAAATGTVIVYVDSPFPTTQLNFPLLQLPARYTMMNFGCNGPVSTALTQDTGFSFVPQPSKVLPEPRNCRRTHSP
jgi:hypothetical protein